MPPLKLGVGQQIRDHVRDATNRFISRFCAWSTSMGYPLRVRRPLPGALRRLPAILQSSDVRTDVVNRTLQSPFSFPISFDSSTCWGYTSGDRLVLGAVGPAWRGIHKVCKDKDTADLVDGFIHFASQYVIRSRIVRIQAGLALTFGVACDFRTADFRRTTVAAGSRYPDIDAVHRELRGDLPIGTVRGSRRLRELTAWVNMLNPLDPFVHRALFQFWRSRALADAGFWEDAVSALDGVSAVAAEAAQEWLRLSVQPSRHGTGAAFGLTVEDQSQLEALYQLRCAFGAHPPPSKWWDFAEMYDSELDVCWDVARRLIRGLCTHELAVRRIDPDPARWSDWFVKHADLLLDLVWFTRLPVLSR